MKKSKIFEPSRQIPATHVQAKGKKPAAHSGTLDNHHNDGGHHGTMDDVSHHDCDAHELPTKIMGN